MQKLPVQSDTVRYTTRKSPDSIENKPRKNYRSLILKILTIVIIILILIIVSAILIKIFVLKKEIGECSSGFFHPKDENNKSLCFPCKLSNCQKCEGNKNNDICTQCINGFNPEYNDKKEIINCALNHVKSTIYLINEEHTSCGENCLDCDIIGKKCSKCKTGYFISNDSDNKLICDQCSLINCEQCEGNKSNNKCTQCTNGFNPVYNDKNEIIKCETKSVETTSAIKYEEDISCGDDCLECDKIGKKCSKCKAGYFIPNDNDNKLTCEKCSLINCEKCEGNKNNNMCTQCNDGFNPIYNNKNEIISCALKSVETTIVDDISCGDDCLECDKIGKKCSKCKVGYFIPDDSNNKLICEKCSLINCEKCEGNKNNNICTKCVNNFIAKYDINNKIKYCNQKCQTGENNKCKECDFNKNECLNCNLGYYIPSDDDIKLECRACSLDHCQNCHGTKISDICESCDTNYEPIIENNIIKQCKYQEPKIENCEIGDGDKCLTCSQTEQNKCASCNPSYKLVDGHCELENLGEQKEENKQLTDVVEQNEEDEPEYDYISYKAKYISEDDNQKIPIVFYIKRNYVKQMKVDGKLVDLKSLDDMGKYTFDGTKKEYAVEVWLDIYNNILADLFYTNEYLKEVYFKKVKNTKNIKLTTIQDMFFKCTNLISLDISNIDTKDVVNIDYTFDRCYSLKSLDLSKNNFQNVKTAVFSFAYCRSLTSINLDTPFTNLEVFNYSFYDTHSLTSLDLSKMKPEKLKICFDMLSECYSLTYVNLANFKVDLVESLSSIFYNNRKLTSVDLSHFNTKNVKDMRWMFFNCSSLLQLDLSSFDTSGVTDMKEMFANCQSLTSFNFGKNFNTWKVTNMSYMFFNCSSVKSIDLRVFDTRNVKSMQYMFSLCRKATKIDVSSFDTSLVTKFEHIYYGCSSLTSVDFSNFNFTTCDKYYKSPPLIYYCSSLKYIDITPINLIFRDFFTGIPNTGGTVRASRKLQYHLLSTGIKVLLNWDWEIVDM